MRPALLLALCFLGFSHASAAPTTPDAFIAAIKSAIASKSTDQLLALSYLPDLSDTDKQKVGSLDSRLLFGTDIASITLGQMPPDTQLVFIANGKKIEPSAPPVGYVVVQFAKRPDGGSSSTSLAYAIVSGGYYLIGSKITDLGWKGPPDQTLSFMVMGQGTNARISPLKVDVKWNASGVEQERTFTTNSSGFMGQYFESVTVTTTDPNGDLILKLMENGKDIAPELKGKGVVMYKK